MSGKHGMWGSVIAVSLLLGCTEQPAPSKKSEPVKPSDYFSNGSQTDRINAEKQRALVKTNNPIIPASA